MKIDLNYYLSTLYDGPWFGVKDLAKGHVYENITVHDKSKKLPSKSEVEKGIKALQEKIDKENRDQQIRAAYQTESDPLFFKYQAGEATEQEWLDKRNEIKARIPKE